MTYYDVFNGDADGICALHQLRLADPLDSVLVTGLKREIALLKSVPAKAGDIVNVLDLSLDANREGLEQLLARGAHVRYFDHHYAGEVPSHPDLEAVIDHSGGLCTSALIDRHLKGRYRVWAVVGAFGDGLDESAVDLARPLGLEVSKLEILRELGAVLNYNAYGETEADVMIAPAALYGIVSHYRDPFELAAAEAVIAHLSEERHNDLAHALAQKPARVMRAGDAYILPDEPWSRRVSGTFANCLARAQPYRAHAVLTHARSGDFVVSVRVPPNNGLDAAEFCRRFPSGGGRKGAGGINHLEPARLDSFFSEFEKAFLA